MRNCRSGGPKLGGEFMSRSLTMRPVPGLSSACVSCFDKDCSSLAPDLGQWASKNARICFMNSTSLNCCTFNTAITAIGSSSSPVLTTEEVSLSSMMAFTKAEESHAWPLRWLANSVFKPKKSLSSGPKNSKSTMISLTSSSSSSSPSSSEPPSSSRSSLTSGNASESSLSSNSSASELTTSSSGCGAGCLRFTGMLRSGGWQQGSGSQMVRPESVNNTVSMQPH
mmetsp:Transcript_10457/g.18263  ORF Transcript_10457/g.18263 Transcript_10457/m.18263 type:complete len:225 (+) Transcript_10457:1035-1709(+)